MYNCLLSPLQFKTVVAKSFRGAQRFLAMTANSGWSNATRSISMNTMQAIRMWFKIAKMIFLDDKKRIWRDAFSRCKDRENAWGARTLETAGEFFKSIILGQGLVLVDIYSIDITDLGLQLDARPDEITKEMRRFDQQHITVYAYEELVEAQLGIPFKYLDCFHGGFKNGRLRIYLATRGPL